MEHPAPGSSGRRGSVGGVPDLPRIEPAGPADAGELLTLQRAAYVTEAQLYDDPTCRR